MLVICEDCAKKYNIDETRIKGDRARFSCRECGHIIVVEKPAAGSSPVDEEPRDSAMEEETEEREDIHEKSEKETDGSDTGQEGEPGEEKEQKDDTAKPEKKQTRKVGRGMPIGTYLLLALIMGFASIVAAFGYLYINYIPNLMQEQVNLRVAAIGSIFAGSVKQPLLVRNYLQVNKEAERVSRLPGVAYAAVVNKRGIVVAGFFHDLNRFDRVFAAKVKASGFPRSIIEKSMLQKGENEKSVRLQEGGQTLLDHGLLLPDSGGAVHVGLYISDIDQSINKALFSPFSLSLIGGIFLIGMLIFLLIARRISSPLRELTDVVNRISLGELDLTITPSGPSEVRELAQAFERMRYSIKSAIERMRKMR